MKTRKILLIKTKKIITGNPGN